MLDRYLRPLIDPPLQALATALGRTQISANAVTIVGAVAGLTAAVAIASGHFGAALALIAVNRVLDGLDGALAQLRGPTDFGGYLDAVGDFLFYAAVPVGFAFADPANALPAAVLLGAFMGTTASFLAFAALAARRGLTTSTHGPKSLYYLTGLAEGTETILAFMLACVFPDRFPLIAYLFAAVCLITVLGRLAIAKRLLAAAPRS